MAGANTTVRDWRMIAHEGGDRHMARIITFAAPRKRGDDGRPSAGGESAEIIIFPGVFYEYLEEPTAPLTKQRLESGGTWKRS